MALVTFMPQRTARCGYGKVCCAFYFAKLSNVTNTFALEGLEVGGNTAVLEVDNSSKRLVQKGTEGANVWIMALKPMSTLPLPMISVTSEGSLGSSKATLSLSSLK
ncbi:hypothetical protein TMatcc_002998 [Talaromyces marneffei ATCC 18224]